MYFLEQIRKQLTLTLRSYDAPSENAAGGNIDEDQSQVGDTEQKPQTGETLAFQELNEELDAIDNDSKLVGTYTRILGSFLEKVKAGEYPGLSEEDDDFQRLLELYSNKFEHLKLMQERGHEIEGELEVYVNQLDSVVDRGVLDGTEPGMAEVLRGNEAQLGIDLKQQEELDRLETQRDAYDGILRDKISNFAIINDDGVTTEYELSEDTLKIVQELSQLIGEEITGDIDAQITSFIAINNKIYGEKGDPDSGLDNELNLNLEFEQSLADFNNTLGGIRLVAGSIGDERLGAENKAEILRLQALTFTGTLQDRTRALKGDDGEGGEHAKATELLENIYALAVISPNSTDPERIELKKGRSEYLERLNNLTTQISPFQGKEGLTSTMQGVIEKYEKILEETPIHDRNLGQGTEFEQLMFIRSEQEDSSLEDLSRLTDIALRDEGVVGENGEKLGNVREESSNEAYEKILEDDSIEAALKDREGNVPKFEELRMNDIVILKNAGVNLGELFLVDTEGKSISGSIDEGQKYIINFGENTHLSGKMDFAFIAMNTQEIIVDGKELTFDTNSFKHEGQPYKMRDGSLIEIKTNFEDTDLSPTRVDRHEAISDQMNNLGIADTHREVIQTALRSDNPQEVLDASTLPGGLAGFFIAMILNFGDGRNFKYDAEQGIFVDQEDEPLTAEGALNDARGITYDDNGNRVDYSSSFEDLPPGVGGLVNTIYQAEANGKPDMIYGAGRVVPIPRNPSISEMTVREVRVFQRRMLAQGSPSSAVGACQVIKDTLDGAIRAGVVSLDEKFDINTQNKFTLWKMEQRGLNRFMSGDMSDTQFMRSLSQEWASLPKDMGGASYYAGDGLNHAGVSPQTMMRHLREIGQG